MLIGRLATNRKVIIIFVALGSKDPEGKKNKAKI